MEVDVDFDLVNKLNVLVTSDHEDLLKQFQMIVGNQINPSSCSFYLEMGNWNLQAALCAYYDVFSTQTLPSFIVLEESDHTGLNSVAPNQEFSKRWKIQNKGDEKWPLNLKLRHVKGHNFEHATQCPIPNIDPEDVTEISILMTAPAQSGQYESVWRMTTIQGSYCGVPLIVSVNVEDNPSINLITHQMSALGQHDSVACMPHIFNTQRETNSFIHSNKETYMANSSGDVSSREFNLTESLNITSDQETIELIDYENL
ncbi:protein ILRUN isoform X1 [Hydra vulgaris]|uniref:Uncharacterized protein C6orf106 n=1 Tax=Hydra vulgaris TaxID=6087 RepID=T2M5D4_HYDVU|nr:protein ILRUN [Hydra vulgaris]